MGTFGHLHVSFTHTPWDEPNRQKKSEPEHLFPLSSSSAQLTLEAVNQWKKVIIIAFTLTLMRSASLTVPD